MENLSRAGVGRGCSLGTTCRSSPGYPSDAAPASRIIEVRRRSSVVEQSLRKRRVGGSNPFVGSPGSLFVAGPESGLDSGRLVCSSRVASGAVSAQSPLRPRIRHRSSTTPGHSTYRSMKLRGPATWGRLDYLTTFLVVPLLDRPFSGATSPGLESPHRVPARAAWL
jgi:hypothetical protein